MKYTLLCILLIPLLAQSQKKEELNFDLDDFNKKAKIAYWLDAYDAVAWWTSDSVMASNPKDIKRLGKEWFCYQDQDSTWHAIYGKLENQNFDQVFHYKLDSNFKVNRSLEQVNSDFLIRHATALQTTFNHLYPQLDSINVRYNQYILENPDSTFQVYFFPAFQTNGWAVHGKEFIFTLDKNGQNIIEDHSFVDTEFLGFEVREKPREIWINQTQFEKPTLGVVFFVWYYKKYFTKINLETKHYITSTFELEDGSYSWIHLEKKKSKRKKRRE